MTNSKSTEEHSYVDSDDDCISFTTTDHEPSSAREEERDEVKEIQKLSQKDTRRVQLWRLAATCCLLVTALAITYTTYRFLKREETNNFETAFEQFSRTVGAAAVAQQQDFRDGIEAMTDFVSTYVRGTNQTWPYIYVSEWEVYARDFTHQAHAELTCFFPKVYPELRHEYIDWSNEHVQSWMWESHMIRSGSFERLKDVSGNKSLNRFISRAVGPGKFEPDINRTDYYFPAWHYHPPPVTYGFNNWDLPSVPDYENILPGLHKLKNETLCTRVRTHVAVPTAISVEEHAKMHSTLRDSNLKNPHTFCFHPIHRDATYTDSEIVGIIGSAFAWDVSLLDLLPSNVKGIHAVLTNDCGQTYTYDIQGGDAIFIGDGDFHEEEFDDHKVVVPLNLHTHADFTATEGHCQYSMHVYPSREFQAAYDSNTPETFAIVVAVTFVVVALVFFMYDTFVQMRNTNLIMKAARTNAIVTSLFPENMRDRLAEEAEQAQAAKKKKGGNLKEFIDDRGENNSKFTFTTKPLADLYLDTTVLYADITGFTAWSSVREPTQVFQLLETIYQEFDIIAKKRRVYKVETVGDCYVAVCGIPNPVKDHAVVMARFARDILGKMHTSTRQLEIMLGPDTADLRLRIGMHSGPVTAGVLRGSMQRFQLFGDTVNVCGRIEASGAPGRIHCSKETADLLKRAGKESWLEQRRNQIQAKGKGLMTTYWVNLKGEHGTGSVVSGSDDTEGELGATRTYRYGTRIPGMSEKMYRLIDWNVEMLLQIMKQIVAQRAATGSPADSTKKRRPTLFEEFGSGLTPLEEVVEIVALPEFDAKSGRKLDPEKMEIPSDVVSQLHDFVSMIATMYNNNPFHGFEHASHVVMSVIKLMSRIIAPRDLDSTTSAALHDHTYGITSDPLTQLACAFSALIHDVDHVGVSNAQLVKEGVPIAAKYKNRSVAEQNSLDLSWDLLMSPEYNLLREFLFPTETQLNRFRQLVVNSVMATDIVDKDLKALRNGRWDKAFKEGDSADYVEKNHRDDVNRKATIVIEHIIQASDISHTMQHWHVYRQWNQKLFEELYVAYLHGRLEKSPETFWYRGEFGFFDFYIIPLTRKLKECGVFGVSSDECLNYALNNRAEWEAKGEDVVKEMMQVCVKTYGTKEHNLNKRPAKFPRGTFSESAAPTRSPQDAAPVEIEV
ncbi:Receptor-type guanylate cyclase gcy [Seminavis robusta]|uniref:Receptor-type guanylate cyclase gcy n=1 Tax=Seminavis robusta TaxID=568900 RepID=A0A9N8H2G0_9STRA|nr:Receptor-type guanylate cyclase gcy [Seminavis robusta]|eukprot:Sro8_g006710.1 Receptor-type guanylate cyclase gcy (1176) ;mRNA; f:123708-128605